MNYTIRRSASLVLPLLVAVMVGTWRKKEIQNTYSENLAVHRKQFKVAKMKPKRYGRKIYKKRYDRITPTHTINDRLDYLLIRKKAVNEQAKYVQGYTIQVYAGGSREEAFKVKNKLYTRYPIITPEVTYHLPNYTVRLGKFLDKLEAYPVYAVVRRFVPQAIIRPISFANKPYIFDNKQAIEHNNPASPIVENDAHTSDDQE